MNWEKLFYLRLAENIVIITQTEDELCRKAGEKGLELNFRKTKFITNQDTYKNYIEINTKKVY